MRICIIGNSHAACWLAAWQSRREYFDSIADIRFFVLGGYKAEDIVRVGDALTVADPAIQARLAKTSSGRIAIHPDDYDHFVIVSLTSGFRNVAPLLSQFGLVSGAYRARGLTFLSRACLQDCINGILCNSIAVKLRGKLAELTEKPVMLSPSPCQSENVLSSQYQHFAELCHRQQQTYLYDLYQTSMDRLARELNFTVLHQDPSTMIDGGCYTRRIYNRNGIGSSMKAVKGSDASHMNEAFGALELTNALRALCGAMSGEPRIEARRGTSNTPASP